MLTDKKYSGDSPSRQYEASAESCRVDPEERLQYFSKIRDEAAHAEHLLIELDASTIRVPGMDLLTALGSVRRAYLNACKQAEYWLAKIDK